MISTAGHWEVEFWHLQTSLRLYAPDGFLAGIGGTWAAAICRLEDADYEGHSLLLLKWIADALDARMEIRFLPVKRLRSA